jgi:hypothetical protein
MSRREEKESLVGDVFHRSRRRRGEWPGITEKDGGTGE